jgi:hypothetical protein
MRIDSDDDDWQLLMIRSLSLPTNTPLSLAFTPFHFFTFSIFRFSTIPLFQLFSFLISFLFSTFRFFTLPSFSTPPLFLSFYSISNGEGFYSIQFPSKVDDVISSCSHVYFFPVVVFSFNLLDSFWFAARQRFDFLSGWIPRPESYILKIETSLRMRFKAFQIYAFDFNRLLVDIRAPLVYIYLLARRPSYQTLILSLFVLYDRAKK